METDALRRDPARTAAVVHLIDLARAQCDGYADAIGAGDVLGAHAAALRLQRAASVMADSAAAAAAVLVPVDVDPA